MNEKQATIRQMPEIVILLVMVGIWVSAAFLIDPRGNFPLADDWAYAVPVRALVGGGSFELPNISTNIIAQILWGTFFCLPLGFSFAALRVSTLTLGLIGVLAMYGLLREAGGDRGAALFGALLLALNPYYLVLSYTFMSDVPFTAVSVACLYFLARGMRRNSRFEVAAGLFLACAALLIRQTGLVIFIAFGLAYLAKSGLRLRNMFVASLPVALGGAVQVLWDEWMKHKQILPSHHSLQAAEALSPHSYLSWQATEPLAVGLIIISMYIGLFLFPLLLLLGRTRWADLCRSRLLVLATLVCALFASYELTYLRIPMVPNVFYDLGLGPATLRDAHLLRLPRAGALWSLVTYVGFAGAVALFHATLVALGRVFKLLAPCTPGKRELLVMLLISGLTYIVPVAILISIGAAFDRYVLFLVPLGIATINVVVSETRAGKTRFPLMPLAVAILALYGAFSIAGTHDYLSWNRARWQALNNLITEQGLSPGDIDGGYEFNGWYLPESKYGTTPAEKLWWVGRADFLVTFGPVPGYTELRRYPYRRWLPPPGGDILVLRRATKSAFR
jgi:hypothetical protein